MIATPFYYQKTPEKKRATRLVSLCHSTIARGGDVYCFRVASQRRKQIVEKHYADLERSAVVR